MVLWKYQIFENTVTSQAVTTDEVNEVHEHFKSIKEKWACEWRRCRKCNEKYTCWFVPLLFFGHKLRSPCIIIEAPEFKIS